MARFASRFWRQYLKQYDTDDTSALSHIELTSMLDSLGSTLTRTTVSSFFTRYGKDPPPRRTDGRRGRRVSRGGTRSSRQRKETARRRRRHARHQRQRYAHSQRRRRAKSGRNYASILLISTSLVSHTSSPWHDGAEPDPSGWTPSQPQAAQGTSRLTSARMPRARATLSLPSSATSSPPAGLAPGTASGSGPAVSGGEEAAAHRVSNASRRASKTSPGDESSVPADALCGRRWEQRCRRAGDQCEELPAVPPPTPECEG